MDCGVYRCSYLNVSHAFHSPLMEPMMSDFLTFASKTTLRAPALGIKLVSNVTGRLARNPSSACTESDECASPAYWCRHVRECVQFRSGMQSIINATNQHEGRIFIEIGPQPTLLKLAMKCVDRKYVRSSLWVPSLREEGQDWRDIVDSLSKLFCRGVPVDFYSLYE